MAYSFSKFVLIGTAATIWAAITIETFAAGAVRLLSAGETIAVNTVDDVVDFPAPQTVAQLPGSDGKVSFREAVIASNNTAGPQTIAFAIPQNEWWLFTTIALLRLEDGPFIITDDQTTVDFSTQTAFTGDTNPNGNEVGIYGLEPNGLGSAAIYVNGNNCVIRGLDTVRQRGYALYVRGNDNRVVGSTISGPLFAAVYITGGFGGPSPHGNIVGGTDAGEGNTLSAGNSGVRIDGPANDNIVIGNPLLTGSFYGVEVRSAPGSSLFAVNNRIGGPTSAERNLISGAGHYGEEGFPVGGQVSLQDAIGTIVQGNFIGTNAAGTASFGQRGPAGIAARNSTNTQILDNLISGIVVDGVNHYAGQRFGIGISLQGNNAGTTIRGNLIGTDASGQNPIPNRAGIVTSSWPGSPNPSNVAVGGVGDGEGNTIAFNETIGVVVDFTARGIRISGNSIDSNGGLGIDLIAQSGGGVTLNDPGDADDGGNGLQNFPVIQSASANSEGTTVNGTFNSLPNSQFSLEFFSSPQCDPSGYGEGRTFLGNVNVTTDSAGNASFQATVAPAPVSSAITSTATHVATGNTSEFSACFTVTQGAAPPLELLSAVSRKEHGAAGTLDISLALTGTPAVESRNGNGNHTFVFAFNNNLVSGNATVANRGVLNSETTISGNTLSVSVSGVSNAQLVTITLTDVTDEFGQVLPDTAVGVKLLIADTNGNSSVNASDVSQTKAQVGQPVTNSNVRMDVNMNGVINSADVALVKASTGTAVP